MDRKEHSSWLCWIQVTCITWAVVDTSGCTEVAHEWYEMFTLIPHTSKLNALVADEEHLAVITFNMALYEKSVQLLDARVNLKRTFFPRLGEQHTVRSGCIEGFCPDYDDKRLSEGRCQQSQNIIKRKGIVSVIYMSVVHPSSNHNLFRLQDYLPCYFIYKARSFYMPCDIYDHMACTSGQLE